MPFERPRRERRPDTEQNRTVPGSKKSVFPEDAEKKQQKRYRGTLGRLERMTASGKHGTAHRMLHGSGASLKRYESAEPAEKTVGRQSVFIPSERADTHKKRAMSKGQAFFHGHFIRNTILICAAVIVVSSIAITTSFARPKTNIILRDGMQEGSRVLEADTSALTVGEFLEDNKIAIGEDDLLENEIDAPIEEGMEIIIRRGMPISVASGPEEEITVNMLAGTVADALFKAGVEPAPQDEVYPAVETYIRPGMHIEHIVVEVDERRDYREIPYDSWEEEDPELAKGSTEIRQYGEVGELEIVMQQIYKNNLLVSEEVTAENVIAEPIAEITAVGTYVKPEPKPVKPKTSAIHSGTATEYQGGGKYQVTVEVTAYCSNCNSGNRTATGVYPSYGTVAAKTSAFPYGTVLYIPGYGYGRVEDTGGFGSNVIDVYMGEQPDESACNAWGRKTLTITVE
ncbi:MAG: G5 domain-containing protein [Christensenellaceae bacterium]|jgi:uncharacterized protein YabE (DUF348 family)